MYLQTKKVVIIFIVMIITFMSIITSLYNQAYNVNLNVSIISSEELAFNNSFAQNIYSDINEIVSEQEELSRYLNLNIYQINDNSIQLDNIVKASDVNIIVGDTFNDTLRTVIDNYSNKQFILVENNINIEADNTKVLNLDYQKIFKQINTITNKDNKSLILISDEYSKLALDKYMESSLSGNQYVHIVVVEDTSDNVKIKTDIINGLKQGYTNVYSLDPYNNQILFEAIDSMPDTIASKIDTKFLALNNTNVDYAATQNSATSFEYTGSNKITKIIVKNENEELVTGNDIVVLSNSNTRKK